MIDKFENWFNKINEKLVSEEVSEVPVATDTTTTTGETTNTDTVGRKGIMSDVDAIMTSLDALSVELTESLNEDLLDKAIGGAAVIGGGIIAGLGLAAKRAYDYKVIAPKAKKAQDSVNKMSIKIAGIEVKLDAADGDMKDKISKKIEASKKQRDSLQQNVDDKFGDKSSPVKKALSISKKEGKMAVLNITMGEGTPEQKADAKAQITKLKTAIIQDEADFKNAQPSQEATDDLKSAVDKEDADKGKGEETEDEETEDEETNDVDPNSKDGKLKRLKDLLAKAEESGIKSKIDTVKDLIDRVSAKESWQVNGTGLGMMLESEIVKLEMAYTLNESRHQNFDIKTRFSSLL